MKITTSNHYVIENYTDMVLACKKDLEDVSLDFMPENLISQYVKSGKMERHGSYTIDTLIGEKFKGLVDRCEDPDEAYRIIDDSKNNTPYPCIPIGASRFLYLVKRALEIHPRESASLIDAGCGAGHNLVYAKYVFSNELEVHGVDYSQFMVSLSKFQVRSFNRTASKSNPQERIYKGDITTFDFSKYDIIYAYNPMQTTSGMLAFFKNVAETARKGTICLFENVSSGEEAMQKMAKAFKPLDHSIFQVI